MSGAQGKPSSTACTPHHVARALQLRSQQHMTWNRLLDLACTAYWNNRPTPKTVGGDAGKGKLGSPPATTRRAA